MAILSALALLVTACFYAVNSIVTIMYNVHLSGLPQNVLHLPSYVEYREMKPCVVTQFILYSSNKLNAVFV